MWLAFYFWRTALVCRRTSLGCPRFLYKTKTSFHRKCSASVSFPHKPTGKGIASGGLFTSIREMLTRGRESLSSPGGRRALRSPSLRPQGLSEFLILPEVTAGRCLRIGSRVPQGDTQSHGPWVPYVWRTSWPSTNRSSSRQSSCPLWAAF